MLALQVIQGASGPVCRAPWASNCCKYWKNGYSGFVTKVRNGIFFSVYSSLEVQVALQTGPQAPWTPWGASMTHSKFKKTKNKKKLFCLGHWHNHIATFVLPLQELRAISTTTTPPHPPRVWEQVLCGYILRVYSIFNILPFSVTTFGKKFQLLFQPFSTLEVLKRNS